MSKLGRPYKQAIPEGQTYERLYESYTYEYAKQAQQHARLRAKEYDKQAQRYAEQGDIERANQAQQHATELRNLSFNEALDVVMYDERGYLSFREFQGLYQGILNERRQLVDEHKLKKPGNIIRSMVSDQRYRVSAREAKRIPKYLREAEIWESDEARRTYSGKELDKKLEEIREEYKKIRKSDWRNKGVDKKVLSKVNEWLKKAKKMNDSYERREWIGNHFFANTDEGENFVYIRDKD